LDYCSYCCDIRDLKYDITNNEFSCLTDDGSTITENILTAPGTGQACGDSSIDLFVFSPAQDKMEFSASSEDIARIVHAHPSLSEVLHEAALGVDGRSLHI